MPNRSSAIAEVSTDRRGQRRFPLTLNGRFQRLSDELHALISVDVSEDCMSFIAGEPLPLGSLIDLNLSLPGAGREVSAVGRITRVRGLGGGKFEATVEFVHISSADRRMLLQHATRADTR